MRSRHPNYSTRLNQSCLTLSQDIYAACPTRSKKHTIQAYRSPFEDRLIYRQISFRPKMAPPTYIISRVADPIFALAIGLGAAALRINREEKEKGRTTQQTINSAKRYGINTILYIRIYVYAWRLTSASSRLALSVKLGH